MRAKFNAYSVTNFGSGESIVLQAVTDNDTPENERYHTATPSGKVEMGISNPAVLGFFTPGKSYYVDFTEAA